MTKRNVRIKDIAVQAEVSTGTVDRVLHNRGSVSEKVRERILRIIQEMNYTPNLMARALGSNKTYHFAALIPGHDFDSYWFAPKLGIEKAELELKQYGVNISQFVFNPYDVSSFIEQAHRVSEALPDGILLSPIFYREVLPFFEKWKNNAIPFVLFNTQIAEHEPLSYIGQNSYQSGFLAGKLIHYGLSGSGSVLIAHIDEEISNAAHLIKKEQGLRDYYGHHNLNQYTILKTELKRTDSVAFNHKLDKILENTPNLGCIFVTTSKAHEIAEYLEQRAINHIHLIGYDLLPANISFLNKGIINFLINQNPKGQGYWGIYQLADHLIFKKEVPALKFLPLDIITKENLEYYTDKDES